LQFARESSKIRFERAHPARIITGVGFALWICIGFGALSKAAEDSELSQ
jgi:hypothetical protein